MSELNQRKLEGTKWVDVSAPLVDGMVHWPGDSDVHIRRAADMERGDDANLTHLNMSAHTGTHMDAPLHFLSGASSLDSMPLEATIGPARVIEISDPVCITANELNSYELGRGERLLFKTANSKRDWALEPFDENFVHFTTDAANVLVEKKVQTVGVDYLSVAGYQKNEVPVHRTLLGAGIWIIEGLYLQHIPAGDYELICLPLLIAGSDGGPARAILRPR